MVDDLAQVVAALDLVLDLAENFADLVFDGVRPAGLLLEAVQVGKELPVDEIPEIVASHRLVVVDLAVLAFGSGPAFPSGRACRECGCISSLPRRPRRPCPARVHRGISGTGARKSAPCRFDPEMGSLQKNKLTGFSTSREPRGSATTGCASGYKLVGT